MSPIQSEGFEKLPEDEKKRVRAAMEKAWSMPALQQAKDRYMKANEAFRTAMRQALQEVDPDVVKILEKIKPQQPPGPRQLPKLPAPTEEGFAKAAVDRLGMELMAFARPEVREKARGIHEKIMQTPAVVEAANKLFAAPANCARRTARLSRRNFRVFRSCSKGQLRRTHQGRLRRRWSCPICKSRDGRDGRA
jgi:hypothetical protein